MLEPFAKPSFGDQDTGNLIIEGDNLQAMVSLQSQFAGAMTSSTSTLRTTVAATTSAAQTAARTSRSSCVWHATLYSDGELNRRIAKFVASEGKAVIFAEQNCMILQRCWIGIVRDDQHTQPLRGERAHLARDRLPGGRLPQMWT